MHRAVSTAKNYQPPMAIGPRLRRWPSHLTQSVLSCTIPAWLGVRHPILIQGVCVSVPDVHKDPQLGPSKALDLARCLSTRGATGLLVKGPHLKELRSVDVLRSVNVSLEQCWVVFSHSVSMGSQLATGDARPSPCRLLSFLLISSHLFLLT